MPLSFEIRKWIVQCIGTCFYYKDNVEAFFISCGIDKRIASKHRDSYKFTWASKLLNDLDGIPDGDILQRKILTELCKFRNLPDLKAANPDAGLSALRRLKELAMENKIEVEEIKRDTKSRKIIAEEKKKIIEERSQRLSGLKKSFNDGIINPDRAAAGYSLEDILEQLFPLFDLDYRKSYKTDTQQIDGHFRFEGFDYLVEAKWRTDQPTESEIGGFERKIETKLESTRGLFVSINGFRDEVIKQFEGRGSKILFMTGEDLSLLLEGIMDLKEALRIKIERAAQEGKVFVSISSINAGIKH
jgi:hypothetical protein